MTASLLGTIVRDDGAKQVTYNGKPLYNFASDTSSGDAGGQDRGGVWFVVTGNSSPVQTAAAVQAAPDPELGMMIWDASGRALYMFARDTANVSTCVDNCARGWPPLVTIDAPVAGDGVTASLLAWITRDDGSRQVTYNGMPLHYFARDEKPGDTNGQARGDLWWVVSPQGEAIGR